jgi:hypothetical protein
MLSSRWFFAVAVVLAVAPARMAMGSPLALAVGGGLRIPLSEAPHPLDEPFDNMEDGDGTAAVGALGATIAYKISPRIAIGVRSGISWRKYSTRTVPSFEAFRDSFSEIPVDVALAMQYEPGRLGTLTAYVMPWFGKRFTRVSKSEVYCLVTRGSFACNPSVNHVQWHSTGNVLGLTTGLDIIQGSAGQVAIFVEAQLADRGGSAVGFGFAFRR